MYIYQNGKLYAEIDGNKIIGVDIYSDKILTVDKTETSVCEEHEVLTSMEVYARFELPILFPREVEKGVDSLDTTGKTKKPSRRATSK